MVKEEDKSDSMWPHKKPRKRLKKLTADICHQMEFYFSDANLRKDRFLKQEMAKSPDGYLNIDILASFNRIKAMTDDRKVIVTALQQSKMLQVSKDEQFVKRREMLKMPKYDPDDCTIYVECLPKKADHEWLQKTFSYCGKVVYISLPRYKSTGDSKGFAFVEFECPDEAERACQLLNNPPPDVSLRAGKFPRTRGRKRLLMDDSEIPADDELVNDDKKTSNDEQKVSSIESEKQTSLLKTDHNEEDDVGKEEVTNSKRQGVKEEKEDGQKEMRSKEEEDDNEKRNTQRGQQQTSDDKRVNEKQKRKRRHSESDEGKKGDRQKKKRQDSGRDDAIARDERKMHKRQHGGGTADDEMAEQSRRKQQHSEGNDGERMESTSRKQQHSGGDDVERSDHSRCRRQNSEGSDVGREGKRKREGSGGDEHGIRHHSVDKNEAKTHKKREHLDSESASEFRPVESKKNGSNHSRDKDGDIKGQTSEEEKHAKSESEKKKRNRRKKTRKMQEEEAIFLRVISKKEWLQLKHEYLALQKESLVRMKQSLRDQRHRSSNLGSTGSMAQTKRHTLALVVEEQELTTKYKATEPEFLAGTVMKLQCLKPRVSRKEVKDQLENISPVAYVDLREGNSQGFVRFQSAEGAVTVLKKTDTGELNNMEFSLSLLAGEEETAYWEKLRLDRINKLSSKQKKKKKRGVDKILKKAERAFPSSTNSHVRFDD